MSQQRAKDAVDDAIGCLAHLQISASTQRKGITIADLPEDVLARVIEIVAHTHVRTLEECARTCQLLRRLARTPAIWAALLEENMLHPISFSSAAIEASAQSGRVTPLSFSSNRSTRSQTPTHVCPSCGAATFAASQGADEPCASHSAAVLRTGFLRSPRVHWDGLYRCKQSYFRPGTADIGVVPRVHLVTYHRYLRFFPPSVHGGARLATLLVTADGPAAAADALRRPLAPRAPQLRRASVFCGRWKRMADGRTLRLRLRDRTGRPFEMDVAVGNGGRSMRCTSYRDVRDDYALAVEEWDRFVLSIVPSFA